MSTGTPDVGLRMQKRLLLAGAALDAAFAVPMLVAPEAAARLLGIELPASMTWFRLAGVLLLIAAGAYCVGAAVDRATHPIAMVAGCGRLLGCTVLFAAYEAGEGRIFFAAGFLDAALAAGHLALVARERFLNRAKSLG